MIINDGYRVRRSPKPVNRRKNRPQWATDDKAILAKVKTLRQWHIARMYWLDNRTASSIAKELKTTVSTVKVTIYRLRVSKR